MLPASVVLNRKQEKQSHQYNRGYFKNPEATEKLFWKDGYLYTGDLGYFDDDGDLYIVARAKNMIKQGGRSLAPRELEEIVETVPRVRYLSARSGAATQRIGGAASIGFESARGILHAGC